MASRNDDRSYLGVDRCEGVGVGGVVLGVVADVQVYTLGGGNSKIFYFHPYLGKIPILANIFQMG